MKNEFERKFLLRNDGWKRSIVATRALRDGLLDDFPLGKIRVRIEHPRAWLTIKGAKSELGRHEFEYEIPLADAQAMQAEFCGDRITEKTRHLVAHDGLTWEIDVYHGLLEGIAYAEVELTSRDQPINLPDWVGQEVTGDPRHGKREVARRRREERAGDRMAAVSPC